MNMTQIPPCHASFAPIDELYDPPFRCKPILPKAYLIQEKLHPRFYRRNHMFYAAPSIGRSTGGRLFATWYSGGAMEPSLEAFSIVAVSDDQGLRWKEIMVAVGNPKTRTQLLDMQCFTDPSGRFWLCWHFRNWSIPKDKPKHFECWAMTCDNADDDAPRFSEPIYIGDGFMRNQPTFLKNGNWLLPAYNLCQDRYQFLLSRDHGKTFEPKYGCKKFPTFFDEQMYLEREDGSLLMIARALKGYLVESVSKDGGETWSEVTQTAIEHPHTRPFIRRLPSGQVLLINNEHKKARINLKVYLSEDDAHTWKHTMMLDSRQTSYPDAVFGDHGEIYIIHDHGRESFKEILVSRITEEDIMAGEIVSHDSYANHIIAKGPSVPELGEEFQAASRAEFEKFLKEIGEVK